MNGMARVYISMVVVALAAATPTQGQVPVIRHATVVDVPTKVLCGDCSIHLTHAVRLGTGSGAGEFYSRPFAVSRLPNVGFAVTESEGGRLLVYGEAGDFRKVVGRAGEGASELSGPGPMAVIGGDSVAVVDFGNGRMAILDPVSLTISRTVRFDVSLAMEMGAFRGHQILLTGASSHPSRIGLPIHSIDLSEDPIQIHSFGSIDGLVIDRYQQERVLASNGDDVWSLRRSEYLLERWDWVTGARLQALRIRPSWFEDTSRGWMGLPNTPPEPRMHAVRVGDDQRVWVYGLLEGPMVRVWSLPRGLCQGFRL